MPKASIASRRWWLVLFAIVAFIGLGFGIYFGSLKADVERQCREDCALLGKSGVMVPVGPASSAAGMRATGPKQCKCG